MRNTYRQLNNLKSEPMHRALVEFIMGLLVLNAAFRVEHAA